MTILEVQGNTTAIREAAVEHAVGEATRFLSPIFYDLTGKQPAHPAVTRVEEYRATIWVAFIVEVFGTVENELQPAVPRRSAL